MARNTGIEHATGEYICFFDSDDYVHKETIEKGCKTMVDNDVEIVIFGMTRVSSQGIAMKQSVPIPDQIVYQNDEVRDAFLPDLIDPNYAGVKNINLTLSACVCLFSVDLIRRTGWRFVSERETISEDSHSLIWLYKYVNSVAILPEALYFYCENSTSLTQSYRADRFDRIREFYYSCTRMAVEIGHSRKVCSRISGLFLSFSIAAMKQIVMADLPYRDQRTELAKIVDDEIMQSTLMDPNCRYQSRMREILFWAMRRRLYCMVYLLVKAQVNRKGS